MRRRILGVLLLAGLAAPLQAQTAADTAAVILSVARTLEREGKPEAARELLRFLRSRYAATAAARSADSLLGAMPGETVSGAGRTGFVTFNTVYGGFLGIAIPAAFGAEDGAAFGVGLLIGAPLGFFGSRDFARRNFRSAGQAGIASFATAWGTWLGLGIQQLADIGEVECNQFSCSGETDDRAPWAAISLGGIAGIGVGWALASGREIRPGTSSLIAHSAFWGSWYGLALGRVGGLENDGLLTSVLFAGNAALLAAIPAARVWRPSSSRVRLITAGGLAGGLAGFGIVLIADPDDEKVTFGIPAVTSAAGLLIGAMATRNQRDLDGPEGIGGEANALLQWRDGLHLRIAIPEPAHFLVEGRAGTTRTVRGARLRLFDARF